MVEVDASLALTGPSGPVTLLDAFEGRRQLIAYYFMWWDGHPAAEQCEGCTWCTTQVGELSYLHSRDITYAVFCQGPYDESIRYRDFMGWDMPWYSAQDSLGTLLSPGAQPGLFHLVCYLRDGDRVFETYWTTRRGVEAMDNSYALMDLTVYGRQESVGGLTRRLAAAVHQHADQRRPARLATGARVAGRTPHRPVAATRSRALRRPHRPGPERILRALRDGIQPDQLSCSRPGGSSQSAWYGSTWMRHGASLKKLGAGPEPNRANEAKSVVSRNAGRW